MMSTKITQNKRKFPGLKRVIQLSSGVDSRDVVTSPVILQISTSDIGGGAEKIGWDLHHAYRARAYHAWLAVGHKYSSDPTILQIPNEAYWAFWIKLFKRIADSGFPVPARFRRLCRHLAKIHHRISKKYGYENFYFPGSRHLLDLPPQKPDILHGHNLHGLYFDLRGIPSLSSRIPVVLTLHDAWLLGGHCAHSLDCERWRTGCGHCPYLTVTVPLRRDGSAYNWRRKQKIYARSRFYVATPSHWLMEKVKQSMLAPAVIEDRVIPNGMDLSVFYPADKQAVRTELGIPPDVRVLLFSAAKAQKSVWKDYQTMRSAVELLVNHIQDQSLLFIALGEDSVGKQIGRADINFVPYQKDPALVARYYQAADVYIHAAKADTFPNAVLEALASGTPVVATAVGGIPEQVDDGVTGFLVPPGNFKEMATAIQKLLQDNTLHRQMSVQADETARRRFDANRMAEEYLEWYQKILS
jgi:glycosyltransferase involved in cell wall biosynthesis